jgi:hypothetical protein
LERLRKAYEDLRIAIDFKKQVAEPRALDRFKDSITQYVEEVSGLLDAGADAFLTTALEERLRAFNAFVAVSKDANEVSRRTVLAYRLPWASLSDVHEVRGKMAKMLGGSRISASVWGVGLEILPDALLGAPLASRDFEKEMLSAVGELKQLIKEVTLGAQQPPRGA